MSVKTNQTVAQSGRRTLSGDLLKDQASTTLDSGGGSGGEWMYTEGMYPFSVVVEGLFVGTVEVLVSNSIDAPSATKSSANTAKLADSFTIPGTVSAVVPFRWVKCSVTAYTSGTIDASFMAVA